MKTLRFFIVGLVLVILFRFLSANAELWVDEARGLVYDTDLNITWLQDANYARTSGYDADGRMNWYSATEWASNLTYAGYSDWRLPATPIWCFGYDCTSSEMGHLYFIELGNTSSSIPNAPIANTGPFMNMSHTYYWSSGTKGSRGWYFLFGRGIQEPHSSLEWGNNKAWAVRDGNSGIVTEPISSILFITGGAVLAGSVIYEENDHNLSVYFYFSR
jgi:hypothetical protein